MAGFAFATKAAIDFESSFAGVRKTVDATEEEFGRLATGLRNLATTIPVTVNEINSIAEAAGQLGIAKAGILSFTETMAMLGVTTNLSAQDAATQLARLANITKLPQDQFENLGSTIVALGNNLATTEAEIVSMGLRLAGAGSSIGLTQAQILSFGGALSSVGIRAESGGTAFSRVFLTMREAVDEGGQELRNFAGIAGISADEFTKAFRDDAANATVLFVEGLGRIGDSGGNTAAVLEDLGLSEIRVRDALMRASGAGDLFRQSLELGSKAWAENTALTKEAEQRFATLASKIQVAKNKFTELAINIGQILMPVVAAFLKAATFVLDFFQKVPGPIQKVIVALAAVASGLALVSGAIVLFVGFLPAISAGFVVLATAMGISGGAAGIASVGFAFLSASMLPILLGVVALAAAIAVGILIWKNWDKINLVLKATFTVVSEKLASIFNSKWAWLLPGGALVKAIMFVKRNWKAIWGGVLGVYTRVSDAIKTAFTSKWGWLLPGGILIKSLLFLKENWDRIWGAIVTGFQKTAEIMSAVLGPFKGILGEVTDEIERLEVAAALTNVELASSGKVMKGTTVKTASLIPPVNKLGDAMEKTAVKTEAVTVAVDDLGDATERYSFSVETHLQILMKQIEGRATARKAEEAEAVALETLQSRIEHLSRLVTGSTGVMAQFEAGQITLEQAAFILEERLKSQQAEFAETARQVSAAEAAVDSNRESWDQWRFEQGEVNQTLKETRATWGETLQAVADFTGQSMASVEETLIQAGVRINDLEGLIEQFGDSWVAEFARIRANAAKGLGLENLKISAGGGNDAPKGSRDSELGIEGRINAQIGIVQQAMEHLGKQLRNLKPGRIRFAQQSVQLPKQIQALQAGISAVAQNRAGILSGELNLQTIFGQASRIPALAAGGIFTSPTLALIAESGPEAVMPLDQMGGMGGMQEIIVMLDSEVIGRALGDRQVERIRVKTGIRM